MTVVRLLNQECLPEDIWLFNATQMTLDMLQGGFCTFEWVPRTENVLCDSLARRAVQEAQISLTVNPSYEVAHLR